MFLEGSLFQNAASCESTDCETWQSLLLNHPCVDILKLRVEK